jgi:vacuolar-type H+-ATPase subunit F/Vma7
MAALWYIGDEPSAAGFRLAGAHVVVPGDGEERAALAAARAEASLVLLSSQVASRLPAHEVARAELALSPLLLVVPGLYDDPAASDRAAPLRGQLGIEDAA